MLDEALIWRAALAFYASYGAAALSEAKQRVEELRQHGPGEIFELWLHIHNAIAQLIDMNLQEHD